MGMGVEVEVQKSQITLHAAYLFLFNHPSIHPSNQTCIELMPCV